MGMSEDRDASRKSRKASVFLIVKIIHTSRRWLQTIEQTSSETKICGEIWNCQIQNEGEHRQTSIKNRRSWSLPESCRGALVWPVDWPCHRAQSGWSIAGCRAASRNLIHGIQLFSFYDRNDFDEALAVRIVWTAATVEPPFSEKNVGAAHSKTRRQRKKIGRKH